MSEAFMTWVLAVFMSDRASMRGPAILTCRRHLVRKMSDFVSKKLNHHIAATVPDTEQNVKFGKDRDAAQGARARRDNGPPDFALFFPFVTC
jgi:hypothetical protein